MNPEYDFMTKAKPVREGQTVADRYRARIYAALSVMTPDIVSSSVVLVLPYVAFDQTVDDLVGQRCRWSSSRSNSQAATQSAALAARFSEVSTLQQRATLTGELDTVEARQPTCCGASPSRARSTSPSRNRRSTAWPARSTTHQRLTGERLRNAADTATALTALSKATAASAP